VDAVDTLVTDNERVWKGKPSQSAPALKVHAPPHAAELGKWPHSSESVGRAIWRVAELLEKRNRIKVQLPAPTNKTRTLTLKQLPEPPKAPVAAASFSD
jgi:hypothetical protein